jgi:TetR/AcrR family transcriptional repressor of nem operon
LISKSIEDASTKALESMKAKEALGDSLVQYVNGYLTERHRDERGNGCLMPALAGEIAREPSAKLAFTRHVEGMLRSFTSLLQKNRKRSARRDAIRTLSTIVGAIVVARAVSKPELSEEILREVRESLRERA